MNRVEVLGVSKGRGGQALPRTSLTYMRGEARLATAETEQRPTVLGLIATGRMRPDSGIVLIDGDENASVLRRRVALIDAPEVSDPASNVTVGTVVAEELMFAGRASHPLATRAWLADAGLLADLRTPIADIAPADRIRLLLELSVLRPGVEGVVLVSPDRHGGDPHVWWSLAEDFAARDLAVLVIAGAAAGAVLAGRARRAETPDVTSSSPDASQAAATATDAESDESSIR